jgi:hypothetical protein
MNAKNEYRYHPRFTPEKDRPHRRPYTLREAAAWSKTPDEFGSNMGDWEHEITRRITSRRQLTQRLAEAPPRLAGKLEGGDVFDAYLAALAEWLSDQNHIPRPKWVYDQRRVAREPWFAAKAYAMLLARSPASFKQRNIFTIPEPLFRPRAGRPKAPEWEKREKAALRQHRYRQRVKALLKKARARPGASR